MAETKARVKDYGVLIAPVVTEKGSAQVGLNTRVVFKVQPEASKIEIREAVERVFSVKVAKVNVVNVMGKPKKTTGLGGRRAAYKKAYVTLREGEKISIVEGL